MGMLMMSRRPYREPVTTAVVVFLVVIASTVRAVFIFNYDELEGISLSSPYES